MAKTNFTKVEDALNEGIMRMTVAGLQDMAAVASQIGLPQSPSSMTGGATKKQTIAALMFEAKHCKDDKLFEVAGIPRFELKQLIQSPDSLTQEDWTRLKEFREKADAYKRAQASKEPKDADEKLVEAQRKKHINKRYNTKEQWLPLH